MKIVSDAELLAEIDRFLAETGMPPSRFGRAAMSDGALIQHLRAGRSLSLKSAERVANFMATYRPQSAQAAA